MNKGTWMQKILNLYFSFASTYLRAYVFELRSNDPSIRKHSFPELISLLVECLLWLPSNELVLIRFRYATILAFDVKVERDAQELADSLGVKIFQADIIYHLFDKFTAYREELRQKKRDEFKSIAVFPCKMKVRIYIFSTPLVHVQCASYIRVIELNWLCDEWRLRISFAFIPNRFCRNSFSIHVIQLWWASWLRRALLKKERQFVCQVKK